MSSCMILKYGVNFMLTTKYSPCHCNMSVLFATWIVSLVLISISYARTGNKF